MKKEPSPRIRKYLYLLKAVDKPFFKIGVSSGSMERINVLDKSLHIDREASFVIQANVPYDMPALEKRLLRKYIHFSLSSDVEEETQIGMGQSELRSISCLPLIIADILSDGELRILPLNEFAKFCPKNANTFSFMMTDELFQKARQRALNRGLSLASHIKNLLLAELDKDKPSA